MERKFLEVGVGVGKKQQQNKKEKAKDKSEVGPEEDTQALRGGGRRHCPFSVPDRGPLVAVVALVL